MDDRKGPKLTQLSVENEDTYLVLTSTTMKAKKNVLIFGGHGGVARALTPLLVKNSHKVHSIIRNPEQIPDIKKLGAHPILQDLQLATVETLVKIIKDTKAEVLVWAAGATFGDPSLPELIDHQAQVRAIDAAGVTDAKRWVSISALDVRDRSKRTPPWYNEDDKKGSERLWKVLKPYMEAKLAADRELVGNNEKRKLEWNIIRPGGLLDEKGSGKVSAGRVHFGKGVSRQDIARVLSYCVDDEDISGLAFDVVGGDVDVDDALDNVAEKREDCFQGFY